MKLAIEFKDQQYSEKHIDLRYGNDGIGGTEYSILKIAFMYACNHPEDEVIAFHYNSNFHINAEIRSVVLSEDYKELEEEKPDILLTNAYLRDDIWYSRVSDNDIRLILLANNFPSAEKLIQFNKHDCVKRIVFKSGQEADDYYDDDISYKEAIIGNMLYPCSKEQRRVADYKPYVTYMGALIPAKGFHLLAEQWKHIVKEVPDAQLHVIGSGQLYNKDEKLGKYGVASESYEAQFIPYLLNSDGSLMDSVIFHGTMGNEKYDILRQSAVGVPNPSGETETFCNVAVEMQNVGMPVVTIAGFSFFDVIDDGNSGFLYHSKKQFRDYIIQLLKNRELNQKMGDAAHNFVKKFYPEEIIVLWEKLFSEVMSDKPAKTAVIHGHLIDNHKIRVIINAFFRKKLGIKSIRPCNQKKRLKKRIKEFIRKIVRAVKKFIGKK